MDDIKFIAEFELLRDIIIKAIDAIVHLWDDHHETFWRSTEHRDRVKTEKSLEKAFFPTVTFCCLEALAEFKTYFSDWLIDPRLDTRLSGILSSGKTKITKLDIDFITGSSSMQEESEEEKRTEVHPFTISRYIHSLVALSRLDDRLGSEITKKIKQGIQELTKGREGKTGVELRIIDHPSNQHPFIVYHAARAFDHCRKELRNDDSELNNALNNGLEMMLVRARHNTKNLLSRHAMGVLSASEAVALTFSAATLLLSENSEDHHCIIPTLRICFERQDSAGCWPLGRVVRENKDVREGRWEISTHEIAWTLGTLLDWCLKSGQRQRSILSVEEVRQFSNYLIRAAQYAQETIIPFPKDPTVKGWCSDHPFNNPYVESWTTANVLQFAVNLHILIEKINGLLALETFKSVARPWDENWPKWLKWKKHIETYEPDTECPVVKYINDRIIEVVNNNPRKLPSAKQRSVSALLFGPPGTQKTSIAKAVADGLGWPIISLSPGDFIEKGLEYIEAQSSSVFSRLHKLSQVVVLFDECDELFRGREPGKGSEQTRGIAAFVTATMLPKIQDLHDKGRVVFLICTNQFEILDKALTRGGRVDHIIAVGPPDEQARYNILEDIQEEIQKVSGVSLSSDVLKELAKETNLFTIPELKHVLQFVGEKLKGNDVKDMTSEIKSVINSMRESLTIGSKESKTLYKTFTKQKSIYSHPHIERGSQE